MKSPWYCSRVWYSPYCLCVTGNVHLLVSGRSEERTLEFLVLKEYCCRLVRLRVITMVLFTGVRNGKAEVFLGRRNGMSYPKNLPHPQIGKGSWSSLALLGHHRGDHAVHQPGPGLSHS